MISSDDSSLGSVRSIINHSIRYSSQTKSKSGRSLANITLHIPDIKRTDASSLYRAIALELGHDIAEKFGRRLHKAFDGNSGSDKNQDIWTDREYPPRPVCIDARYIIATYRAAISAGTAFYNPRGLLFKLLAEFAVDSRNEQRDEDFGRNWSLVDVLGVISVAATTVDERESTAGLLDQSIKQQFRTRKAPVHVSRELLLVALTPNILHNFRKQVLEKLSSAQRLKILAGEEDTALRQFANQSRKIGLQRMIQFRLRRLQKYFISWRLECYLSKRAKRLVSKQFVKAWREETHRCRMAAFFETLSRILYHQALMSRCFRKWTIFLARIKKIKRCFVSDAQKRILSGMGCVRRYKTTDSTRKAIAVWIEFVRCSRNEEQAIKWNDKKVLRRAFRLYHQFTYQQINVRKSGRKASIQMKNIEKFVNDIDASLLKKTHEKYLKGHAVTLSYEKEKANQPVYAQLRKNAIQSQIDADILFQQQKQRRERAESDKRQLESTFNSKWTIKASEELKSGESRIINWMKSAECADLCLKKEKEMKRVMLLDSVVGNEQEQIISSRPVISYSVLDGFFACAGICADEFFHFLPPASVMSLGQFRSAVCSCEVSLAENQILDIFGDLCLDLTTNDESPIAKFIAIKDLYEYRRLSDKFVAPEGALWKTYACPYKQELLFHNISTNEKIYESNVRKKHVRRIVQENLHSSELMKVRTTLFHKKCKAHGLMIQHYRAKQIQFMYRQWKGRRSIKKQITLGFDECSRKLSLEECVVISIAAFSD